MDGVAFCLQHQEILPRKPVVIMTGREGKPF